MQKAYNRINWENYPVETTPLNESNLNRMDAALNEIDNRVVEQETTKANQTDILSMISDVVFDETTGIFTFTRKNGATVTLDTKLEKLAMNWNYDSEKQKLEITLEDGTKQEVDLSALIGEPDFEDSDTIAFLAANGMVSAVVKEGSIEERHLQPNYLADVKAEVGKAQNSAESAAASATESADSALAAKDYAAAAAESAEMAESIVGVRVTGVKGNAETEYRKGNINLTPANLGAAEANHTHDYAESGHTHNYAGASAPGGAATLAVKATGDSAGQQINKTYIKGVSANKNILTLTKGDGTASTITLENGEEATVYYNAETDQVQILDASGNWIDWKTGGLQNLYLVKDGVFTGACLFKNVDATVTIEVMQKEESVSFYATARGQGFAKSIAQCGFDMTKYSKLVLQVVGYAGGYGTGYYPAVGISSSGESVVSIAEATVDANGELVLDISAINQIGYIYFYMFANDANYHPYAEVTQMYLEQ